VAGEQQSASSQSAAAAERQDAAQERAGAASLLNEKQLEIAKQKQGERVDMIFDQLARHFQPASVEFLGRNVLSAWWDPEVASVTSARIGSWLARALSDLQGQHMNYSGPGNSDHIWSKHQACRGWMEHWEAFVSQQPAHPNHEALLSWLLQTIEQGCERMDRVEAEREARIAEEEARQTRAGGAGATTIRPPVSLGTCLLITPP
jgi:hypothetical protein